MLSQSGIPVIYSGDSRVLALCRRKEGRELVCLFNFSRKFAHAGANRVGSYTELMYDVHHNQIADVVLYPCGFAWLLKDE